LAITATIAAQGGGALLALGLVPVAFRLLGVVEYGSLSVLTSTITILTVIDFGLGRTVTLMVAAADSPGEVWQRFVAASGALLIRAAPIAVIVPVLLTLLPTGVAATGVRSPVSIHLGEAALLTIATIAALQLMLLRAAFDGRRDFIWSAVFRFLSVACTYGGPVIGALWHPTARAALAGVTCLRAVVLLGATIVFVRRLGIRDLALRFSHRVPPQFKVGMKWLAVSSVIAPSLVALDRWMLGALAGAAAVARYSISLELANAVWLIPSAVGAVFFASASSLGRTHEARVADMSRQTNWLVCAITVPLASGLVLNSGYVLKLWLRQGVPANEVRIVSIVAVAAAVVALGWIPQAALQATNRASAVAKVHLLEVILFPPILAVAVSSFAETGAAWTLLGRSAFEAACLNLVMIKALPSVTSAGRSRYIAFTFVAGIVAVAAVRSADLAGYPRVALALAVSGAAIFAACAWVALENTHILPRESGADPGLGS
jgi:O-antigen/teichoic acid export membrane protein